MNKQLQARLATFRLSRGDKAALAFAMVMGGMSAAHAEVDITLVTAAGVSVGLIGLAVFGVKVGTRLYKWLAAAL